MPSVTGEAFYRESYIPGSKGEPPIGVPLDRVPSFTPGDFTIESGWAVYTDKGDDKSTIKGDLVGFYLEEEEAEENRRGHGWWGGNGIIEKTFALKINDDSYFLLIQPEPVTPNVNYIRQERDARNEALRKLSGKERKLLNLPDPEDDEDDQD